MFTKELANILLLLIKTDGEKHSEYSEISVGIDHPRSVSLVMKFFSILGGVVSILYENLHKTNIKEVTNIRFKADFLILQFC